MDIEAGPDDGFLEAKARKLGHHWEGRSWCYGHVNTGGSSEAGGGWGTGWEVKAQACLRSVVGCLPRKWVAVEQATLMRKNKQTNFHSFGSAMGPKR